MYRERTSKNQVTRPKLGNDESPALLLFLFFLLTPTVAWAALLPPAPTSATTQEVRRLYPNEWGVDYVEGVAFATALNHLYLLSKS